MQVNKKFFPQVMQDNEIAYFAHLEGVIASVDELSTLEITKNPLSYHFRLAPSLPMYNEMSICKFLLYCTVHCTVASLFKIKRRLPFYVC